MYVPPCVQISFNIAVQFIFKSKTEKLTWLYWRHYSETFGLMFGGPSGTYENRNKVVKVSILYLNVPCESVW